MKTVHTIYSTFAKHNMAKFLTVLTLLFTLGVGSVLGAALGDGYEKVTDISTLSAGDRVVLYCDDNSVGVTGWDGNKDAEVAASGWVEYLVESATGGVYLKDENASSYIASPGSSNQFKYGTKAVCTVDANGVLKCNNRFLVANGTYYRMYSSVGSYEAFYVYKVLAATPYTVTFHTTATEETECTEASAGAGVTPPTMKEECGDWTFQGWSKSPSNSETSTTKLDLVTLDDGIYYPTADAELYPVYTKSEGGGGTAYTKVATISEGVYVMVSEKTSGTYKYMPNTTSSGTNPNLGSGITISTTSGITSLTNEVTDAMLWDFTSTGTANQFYLRPHGSTTIGLGCTTSTGANIRISSTYKDVKWTITTSSSYGWQFKSNASSAMYLAVYSDSNWRNYTSSTTNQNGKFHLFKQTSSSTTYYFSYPQCATEATVTLDLDGGSFDSKPDGWEEDGNNYTKTVNSGDQVTLPEPNKTGHDFEGWYNASTKVTSPYILTGNTTLTAHWTPQTYDITYKDQGDVAFSGTHENNYPTQHTYGIATTLKGATKIGYTFEGWHTDATCTNKVTKLGATEYAGAITLYAKWTAKALTNYRTFCDVVCDAYSFHTGSDADREEWSKEAIKCFVEAEGGFEHEWQIKDYIIPNDDDKFFVGNYGYFYNDNLGIGGANGKSRSVVSDWGNMYLAPAMDENDAQGTPRLGHAKGAKGTLRIFEDSNWDNLFVGFIPDGYKLKFGNEEYTFAKTTGTEYRSDVVQYNSTNADKNVSVGVVDADGKYVATNHTQEMRHIFLEVSKPLDGGSWADANAKFAIYYWNNSTNGWCGFLKNVPSETTLYEGWVPVDATGFKFVRYNNDQSAPGSWDNDKAWNQTGDLTFQQVQENGNLFTITDWGTGTWSTYEKYGQFAMHDNSKSKNWYVHFVPHYVLTYDKNADDATGEMDVQTVAVDADDKKVVVANCGFTRPGYRFIKWKYDATLNYNAGVNITLNKDITLYAVWEKEYTVAYNANGGTTTCEDNNKYIKGEQVTVCNEVPTKTGYTFLGWSDGNNTYTAGGTFTMPASDVTLTAQWEEIPSYIVTYSVGNGDTAPEPAVVEPIPGSSITLPSLETVLTCVKFVGWTDADNDADITSSNIYKAGDTYTVNASVTLKAVYAAGGGFVLVTDASELAIGDHIVIAAAEFDVAMGADRGNNRGEVEVTKDNTDNTITTPDGIQILTLEAGTTAGTLAFNTGEGYLYAASSSSNYLKTQTTNNANGSWKIEISAAGVATIKAQGSNTRNWLRYNSNNNPHIFSCYASGQADVSIYKESITGYTTDPECEEYDITLEVIGHANGSAKINGQTATPTTSQTVTILNTKMATISDVANVAGYDVTVRKRSGNATFTDNGNGTWTVSEPASNVTIQVQYTAKQTYKVQFVTGTGGVGNFTSLDAYKGQTVTIPANYGAVGLCGEFVGWTEGARASGEKPTKLYQPGDPFTLNSNGTSLYAVYSISASCTSEFALGKSGDYEMYAIYSNNVYYVTQKNGSNDYFYANTEADIEANARVKSTFRMQYDATQTAAWNEQDVYAYTIYISNGSTEYGFWHLNSMGKLEFDAIEPYYWKVKSYNGGYDIYGEANGRTYRITCNGSNFNARTSADAVYFTPGGGIEYWTDIDCSDINVDVTFAWNQFESWPVGMPNANSYKGLAKCSEITEFPIALQEGWTFLGWSTKEYNALHADDLDDENNASRAYPDGSDIYKTGGNTLTLGSADITLYPVFTRYEENEPLNLVNGGEFYMYVKPGNTDVYGGVRRFYIADVNLSSGGFTSTEDCNDARPFTFIKEDAGWLIQFVDEGGKTYYLGASAAASDLTKHQTSKTYWDITVGTGNNPVNAYRMMAIGQGSEDALLAKVSNGLTSATFKYYAIENLINTPSVYFDIFLGSCEDRVFSSDPTSKPSVTITGGGYVTGSKGQTVFVPSAFTITGKNLNDNYNVNIADVGGLLKFYNEAGNVISNFGKPLGGKLAQTTFYVAYTPTADTDGTEIPSIIVTNGTGGSALNQEITDLIHARHLPAEFAIVAKIGGNWYALPDTALHVQTPEGLLVEVDNVDSPTAVTQSFCNATAWSLRGVKNTRYVVNSVLNGDNVLFAETNTEVIDNRKMLYAGEDSKVGAYATYTNYTATNPDRYEWQLTTTDNITYTVNSNSTIVSDPLSVNNSRAFGTHGKFVASEEIRLLPIEGPCIAPAVFQVIEWKTNGMIIMYTGAGVSATTQVGTYAASDAKMREVDHGVYELTTSQDLTACTGLKLAITFTDASSNKTQKVLVIPAIVSGEKGSTSLVASNAVAKVTDVVVLDDAKLTADGTQYTYNDVVVYPGGNLVIDTDGKLGMYTLTLRTGSSWGAAEYEHKYPQFLLKGDYSNSSGQINLDYVTTQDYYYPLSVPEEVTIGDIKYPVDIYGNNVKANNTGSFQLKYYDGAQRATGATGWVVLDEKNITKLSPNSGYAFWGIPKKVSVNGAAGVRQTYGIHRIPIKIAADKLLDHEKRNEEITIQAYAAARPNDQGWNYLGNPYLAGLGGMNGSDEDLLIGLLEKEIVDGQWTGGWVYNEESVNNKVRYITITNDCQNFEALPVANAKISPFTTFFIQAASVDDQKILLTAPASVLNVSSLPARHYAAQQETAKEITTGILLTGNDQTDRTGLLIADNFTEEYDYNADLSKFENSGINLYTIGKDGKLAFMAINQALAEQPIPVGYTAPAEGLYTIAFDEDRYNATDISALYLIDYDSNEKTNLLHTDYSFVTAAGTNNQRFALQVAFAPENATNIEWVGDATIQVGVEDNTLMLNNLPTDAAVHVFDALGRLMYHAPTVPTEMQLTLPTGYYLVRIADKQNAVVIKTVIP